MVLCFVIVRTTGAGAAMLEDAQAAYNRQDYRTASELWKILAQQGDAEAEFNLGMMYDYGFGMKKDSMQAVDWFRRAAVQGHVKAERHYEADNFAYHLGLPKVAQAKASDKTVPVPVAAVAEKAPQTDPQSLANIEPAAGKAPVPPVRLTPEPANNTNDLQKLNDLANKGDATAQLKLGNFYALGGSGVSQDYELAAAWYTKAAEQGNADAEELLGDFYNMGAGVSQSYTAAARLYRQSAEQNNAQAQTELARLYAEGHGVSQDYGQAAAWYTKAAAQGNAEAAYELGNLYAGGIGVKQDYKQAKGYYLQAVKQGNAKAQAAFDSIAAEGLDKPQENVLPQSDLQKAAAGEKTSNADNPQQQGDILARQQSALATKQGLDAGVEFSGYRYRETFGRSDPFVNQSGRKFGGDVGYTYVPLPDYFMRVEGRVAEGPVNYSSANGNMRGEPDREWEGRLLAGGDINLGSWNTSPYIGYGTRFLYNDARGTAPDGSRGYRRISNYRYIPLGFTERVGIGQGARLAANIEYDIFAGGWQKSYLRDIAPVGFENIRNKQHKGFGTRGSLMVELDKLGFSAGPWFNYWHIGTSNWVADPFNPPLGFYEPDNTTREFGIRIVKDFW
jgi:TPR repeat protein